MHFNTQKIFWLLFLNIILFNIFLFEFLKLHHLKSFRLSVLFVAPLCKFEQIKLIKETKEKGLVNIKYKHVPFCDVKILLYLLVPCMRRSRKKNSSGSKVPMDWTVLPLGSLELPIWLDLNWTLFYILNDW